MSSAVILPFTAPLPEFPVLARAAVVEAAFRALTQALALWLHAGGDPVEARKIIAERTRLFQEVVDVYSRDGA